MSELVCRYCQERLGHPNNGLCGECQSVQDEATKPLHVRIETLERELADMSNGLVGQTAENLRLQRQLAAARHDLLVYRGALGYPVPGDTDDCLSDGTRPVNGIAEAMGWHHEENQRLQGDLVRLRAEVERATRWAAQWAYLAGQDDEYDYSRGRPSEPFSIAWARYQREREGGEK